MGTEPLIQLPDDGRTRGPAEEGAPLLVRKSRISRVRAWVAIILGLVLWQVIAQWVVHNNAFLASPVEVARRGWEMLRDGQLLSNAGVSGEEFLLGFVLGSAAGVLIGALMAVSDAVHDYLEPWIAALYSAPIVALAPLVIIWFGIGVSSKVVVVIFMVIFPMIINTEAGLRATDKRLTTAALSFGANAWQQFTTVSMPSAAPFVVAGLRLAVGRGLVGVVVGELFGARAGLGNVITNASNVFDMPTLFVAVVTLALAGIILTNLLQRWERHLASWRDIA